MRSSLINSVAAKVVPALLVGALLVVSLFGLYRTFTTPRETQISIPLVSYQQRGKFDYTVHLRPNTLFDTTELGPGQAYFARLVNDLRMAFSYEFTSDQPLRETRYEYQVHATFGSPALWEKSFPLVPPTVASDDFTVSFALPLAQFMELMDTIREETGAAVTSPQLTVKARVQPQVQTPYGPIAEPFEQTLLFNFDGDTIRVGEELEKSQPGTITEATTVPVAGLEETRNMAGAGAAVSLLLLAGLAWGYARVRTPAPVAEQELQQAQKRHKELLVRARSLPPVRDDQTVIYLHSLPDLLNLAEEMYRPVIYCPNGHSYTYCVIDGLGSVRYEYSERDEAQEPEGRAHHGR